MISMSKSVRREKNIERIAEIKASLSAAVEIEEDESSQNLQNNEESEDDSIMEIERIQALGISVSEINKLKAAGIHTVAGLLMQSKKVRFLFLYWPQIRFYIESDQNCPKLGFYENKRNI